MATPAPELPQTADDIVLEGFLDLAVPAGFRAELIEGEIVVSPPPDGDHEDIIAVVNKELVRHSAIEVYAGGTVGLVTPQGRYIPDSVVGPDRLFRGRDNWMSPEGILLVLEVASTRTDKDRLVKRCNYAAAEIPAYLLVDRTAGEVVLYSEPRDGDYRADIRVPFGKPLDLPEPFSFTLDTALFA